MIKKETEVVLGYDQDGAGIWNMYVAKITAMGFYHGRKTMIEEASFDFSDAEGTFAFAKAHYGFFQSKDKPAIAYVTTNGTQRTVTISVSADTREDAIDYMREMRAKAKIEKITDETLINVNFWSMTSYGGTYRSRKLAVPAWAEIKSNYASTTAEELEEMMAPDFRPGSGGQLILWYGEPGTGKTTALRALAREWKSWCNVEYIADPERFFGSETDYMLSVLISDDEDDSTPSFMRAEPTASENESDNKWRLLVLEDAGELLAHDARTLAGAGLGRFLNVVDGLIGQGLKIIVLVTTNEELSDFHQAVSRPGRCLAQINFKPLNSNEALSWLEDHDAEDTNVGTSSKTLAELYAKLHKHDNKRLTVVSSFGFGS